MRAPASPIPVALRGLVLGLLALLLAACSAGALLTDAPPAATPAAKGKTPPPVAFQQITGIPPAQLSALKVSLAGVGGARDIAFVEGSFQSGVFSLGGMLKAATASTGVSLTYELQFRDADGVLIDTVTGEENAGLYSGADPWGAVNTAVLDRVARRTVEEMARKLSAMGYATRVTSLTAPPAELFARADDDAHREVDFETVNGPGLALLGDPNPGAGRTVAHEEIAPSAAAVAPLPGEGDAPKVALTQEHFAPAPPGGDDAAAAPSRKTGAVVAAAKAEPGKNQIRAVAVVSVSGSPGKGGAELAAAMRSTLSAAGWPVVSRPQADALTIEGKVVFAPAAAASQRVSVVWTVRAPDGRSLGDVKQANDVPAGSLDKSWGPAAPAVAEAAASGIFDIVRRFQ